MAREYTIYFQTSRGGKWKKNPKENKKEKERKQRTGE